MASLDDLEAHLLKIDSDFADSASLQGVSFDKTQNSSLGFSGIDDFTVFIPWKKWPDDPKTLATNGTKNFPSALQEAFKDVLNRGKATDKWLIDMATLDRPSTEFFCEKGDGTLADEKLKSVAKTIADVIEGVDDDNANITSFEEIFWHDKKPLITNKKNAMLYVGYYSPSYNLKDHQAPLQMLRDHVNDIQKIVSWLEGNKIPVTPLRTIADQLATASNDQLLQHLGNQIQSVSWNHGKILAVNGKTMMTGSANYWWQNRSDTYDIIEQQCKIGGDATGSAHAWSDYFFRYLNKRHGTDSTSFLKCVNLNQDYPPNWTDEKAPMSTVKPKTTIGQYKVVQALKDLVMNVVWQSFNSKSWVKSQVKSWTKSEKLANFTQNNAIQGVAVLLVDDLFTEQQVSRDHLSKAIGSTLSNPYKTLRVNPTAWASRMTRLNAIANAQKSVVICQHRITLPPLGGNAKIKYVENINKHLALGDDRKWDGYAWPYDLLIALSYALAKPKGQTSGSADIQIVLKTHYNDEGDPQGGWGDTMLIEELKNRLKMVMKGMAFLPTIPQYLAFYDLVVKENPLTDAQLEKITADLKEVVAAGEVFSKITPIPEDEVNDYVDQHFQVKRVLHGDNKNHKNHKIIHYNHSKVVCVDDKLMHMGSDNIYPCYCEEHGVWIDDVNAIQAWKAKFRDKLWNDWTDFPKEESKKSA